MQQYGLKHIPERTKQPRSNGLTMVMDKGLSIREVEDMLSIANVHIDIVKLGWATSLVSNDLEKKINAYKSAKIPVYFGGTLFEAFVIRKQFDDYRRLLNKYGITYAEVSDGSIEINHDIKCQYIADLSREFTVLSEVGSKDADKIIPPYKWIEFMKKELQAGSYKLIAESREAGNVGIFRGTGEVRSGLVDEILTQVSADDIIWEAPQKSQQVYFVKLIGSNVNLGNIAPAEVIPLETVRLGLRGDTFMDFLPKSYKSHPITTK